MTEPVCIRNWKENWERHKAEVAAQEKDSLRKLMHNHLVCTQIECWNGLRVSAQSSPMHYCSFRSKMMGGDKEHGYLMDGELPKNFEVMLFVEELAGEFRAPGELAGATEDPVGWVDIETVEELIRMNGGWKKDPPTLKTAPNVVDRQSRKLDL